MGTGAAQPSSSGIGGGISPSSSGKPGGPGGMSASMQSPYGQQSQGATSLSPYQQAQNQPQTTTPYQQAQNQQPQSQNQWGGPPPWAQDGGWGPPPWARQQYWANQNNQFMQNYGQGTAPTLPPGAANLIGLQGSPAPVPATSTSSTTQNNSASNAGLGSLTPGPNNLAPQYTYNPATQSFTMSGSAPGATVSNGSITGMGG